VDVVALVMAVLGFVGMGLIGVAAFPLSERRYGLALLGMVLVAVGGVFAGAGAANWWLP
jgi:hypothetical protein